VPLDKKKAIERVEKLLRLAAPTSGATPNERESAALEAAKVFSENNLAVVSKDQLDQAAKAAKARRPRTPSPVVRTTAVGYRAPVPVSYGKPGWQRSVAAMDGVCADPTCSGSIQRGDDVWARTSGSGVEYLHVDGPCCW